MALTELGDLAVHEGRPEDALPLLREALSISHERGDRHRIAMELGAVARALALAGEAEKASQLLSKAERLFADMGVRMSRGQEAMNEETIEAVREQLDEDAFAEAWAHGRSLDIDAAVTLALADAT